MKRLHLATHFVLAVCAWMVFVSAPDRYRLAAGFGAFALVCVAPPRNRENPTKGFLRVLAIAAGMLFTIHTLRLAPPFYSPTGLQDTLAILPRIAMIFATSLWLAKTISREDLFSALNGRLPPALLFSLFQGLALIPEIRIRSRYALLAQQSRGVRMTSALDRFRATVLALSTIVAATLVDMTESSLGLASRGVLLKGPKSSVHKPGWERIDLAVCSLAAAGTILILVLKSRW